MKNQTDAQGFLQILPDPLRLSDVLLWPGLLDAGAQGALLEEVRGIVRAAPLMQHETPQGKRMSVQMTAAGDYGWISDRTGYRYAPAHPSGTPWPPVPPMLLALWRRLLPGARAPQCCLVNVYGQGARMGLHQDRDEADLTQPVLSVSLGDEGLFRVGGTARGGPTRSHWLRSGDVLALQGASRLAYHGVDRIRFATSTLLAQGGRINLTLRVVT